MTLAFTLSIALLTVTVCAGMVWYARHAAEHSADTLLNAIAEKVKVDLTADTAKWGGLDMDETEREDLQPNHVGLLILDPQGHIRLKSSEPMPANPQARSDAWRLITARTGTETVVVGMDWRPQARALAHQAFLLYTLGLVVVLSAAVGAWLLVGKTLSPIGLLSRQAQAASTDSLRVRLSAPSHDTEIVELVATLNGLLARLSEAAAAKGRFHAAASHELRTPLQALSGHLSLALKRSRTRDEYQAVVEEANRQTQRLTTLVRDVLLLSQLDSSPAPSKQMLCMGDLCENALCSFGTLIEARGLQVQTDGPTSAVVFGVPTYTEILVRNLIENAVKYASPNGSVRVRVAGSPEAEHLEIFNECPPVAEWNQAKLFEPFYRPDVSRDSKTGGVGLGLAICKAIADISGRQLTLEQEADGVRCLLIFSALPIPRPLP